MATRRRYSQEYDARGRAYYLDRKTGKRAKRSAYDRESTRRQKARELELAKLAKQQEREARAARRRKQRERAEREARTEPLRKLAERVPVAKLSQRFDVPTSTVETWLSRGVPKTRADDIIQAYERSERARAAALARHLSTLGRTHEQELTEGREAFVRDERRPEVEQRALEDRFVTVFRRPLTVGELFVEAWEAKGAVMRNIARNSLHLASGVLSGIGEDGTHYRCYAIISKATDETTFLWGDVDNLAGYSAKAFSERYETDEREWLVVLHFYRVRDRAHGKSRGLDTPLDWPRIESEAEEAAL